MSGELRLLTLYGVSRSANPLNLESRPANLPNSLQNARELSTAHLVQLCVAHRRGNKSRSDKNGLGEKRACNCLEIFSWRSASFSHSGLKCISPFRRSISAAASWCGRAPLFMVSLFRNSRANSNFSVIDFCSNVSQSRSSSGEEYPGKTLARSKNNSFAYASSAATEAKTQAEEI
jgi:hypothetical protein